MTRSGDLRSLPAQANLRSAAKIGRPYRQVLEAALLDSGYLDAASTDPRPYDAALADAIRALTEAARLTDQSARQTSSDTWEPDPNGTPHRIDWAAFATEVLAGAAANIGGTV